MKRVIISVLLVCFLLGIPGFGMGYGSLSLEFIVDRIEGDMNGDEYAVCEFRNPNKMLDLPVEILPDYGTKDNYKIEGNTYKITLFNEQKMSANSTVNGYQLNPWVYEHFKRFTNEVKGWRPINGWFVAQSPEGLGAVGDWLLIEAVNESLDPKERGKERYFELFDGSWSESKHPHSGNRWGLQFYNEDCPSVDMYYYTGKINEILPQMRLIAPGLYYCAYVPCTVVIWPDYKEVITIHLAGQPDNGQWQHRLINALFESSGGSEALWLPFREYGWDDYSSPTYFIDWSGLCVGCD